MEPPNHRPPRSDSPDPYAAAWADLRMRRTILWASMLAWIPVALMAGAVLHRNLFLAVLPLLAVVVFTAWRASAFRCPQCGEAFGGAGGRCGWPSRTCRQCGIPIGTPKLPSPHGGPSAA
jgi:hypothetical protein